MATLGKGKAMCVVLIAALLVAAEAAVTCNTVVSSLSGCLAYVTNTGPLGGCCSGVTGLYNVARTTPDRQTICRCIKSVAASYPGIDFGKAAGLPKLCNVNIPYKISPSTDCSTYVFSSSNYSLINSFKYL